MSVGLSCSGFFMNLLMDTRHAENNARESKAKTSFFNWQMIGITRYRINMEDKQWYRIFIGA